MMPIEIKELHIQVAVSAESDSAAANKKGAKAGGSKEQVKSGANEADTIIAECVEQVLQILQSKSER